MTTLPTPQRRNANRHTQRGMAALEQSVQADGWIGAITVAADDETFDGSARIDVAAATGFDDPIVVESDGTRPVVVRRVDIPSADDPRAVRLGLAANRVAQVNLEWDTFVLAELGAEIDLSTFWTKDEIAALLEAEIVPGNGGDDFDITPEDGPTRAKRGDVWQLGRHRIACIDSTDAAAVQSFIGNEHPAMVWSDPPYGIEIVAANGYVGGGEAYDIPFGGVKKGYVGGGERIKARTGLYPIQMRGRSGLGTVGGAKPFGSQVVRGSDGASNMIDVGKYAPVIGDDSTATAITAYLLSADLMPTAIHIWWGANYYADALPPSSCWIVWDKENTGNFADAELAWCSDKSAVRIFRHMWNGLMKASERGVKRVHPTQKPVALAAWAFEKYGKEDDLIYDPFLGSGMSIIAAERTGRRIVGCELAEAYIDVCCARFEAETGIAPVRVDA